MYYIITTQQGDQIKETDHFKAFRYSLFNKCILEQCKKCNGFGGGENYIMGKYIDKTFGVGTADELISKSRQIQKFSNTDLEEMIEEYKNKVKYL